MPFVADFRGEPTLGLRERKKKRTRAMLIDSAVDLCVRQGFDRTTVDQIAAVADVSPRTFSRYFPTKDAIALALVDEVLEAVAAQLTGLPNALNQFEALMRAHVAMAEAAKAAPSTELTAERVMCIIGILLSSPTLRQAALEFRANAVDIVLAERMGATVDDRPVRLVSAVAGALIMTALTDLAAEAADWSQLGIDDVIARVEAVFTEFTTFTAGLRQPV
jgi:AcrR family transcriptional regulator